MAYSRRNSQAKVTPTSTPAFHPTSSVVVRGHDEHAEDVVYVVPTPSALQSPRVGNSPKGSLTITSTPLINSSVWYKSPHGFAPLDHREEEVALENEMDELCLDLTTQISAPFPEITPQAAAKIETERFTFANISHIEIDHESLSDDDELNKPTENSPHPPAAKYFKWPVQLPSLLQFRKGGKQAPNSPRSSPLAFLALASAEEVSSHEKKQEYKRLKTLGYGVQGVVALSVHLGTGKKVALKAIPVQSGFDPNVRASFRKEVELMQKVRNHPNIIRLVDFWEGKAKVYQAFEVCLGGELATGLGAVTPMNESYGARLFAPIVDAVRHLHDLGFLHRDIRPANIFLRKTLTGSETQEELKTIPVLADFGIACKEGNSGRLGTQFIMRPPHIAPEVVDGARFSKASDVFGLGVCLITILLGRAIDISDQDAKLSPREEAWTDLSLLGKKFVRSVLQVDPSKRITAVDALKDPWFEACGVSL
ncbi:UNVERIFIED_CONTAM: hypothetical protein HDU68_000572 [Siphonaria sp. JEL0065]|nr:hypothetical protein HDU68_000572 [Siphonaria sp. JEL0065]